MLFLVLKQAEVVESPFIEAARVSEVRPGQMKGLEVKGVNILIANVDGSFYAMNDRCGHMNALLSMGTLKGQTVICPLHFAEFDIATGKKTKEPIVESFPDFDKLPEDMQKYLQYVQKLIAPVKTLDMQTYPVKVDGDKILIRI